jgi:hypothetical protein
MDALLASSRPDALREGRLLYELRMFSSFDSGAQKLSFAFAKVRTPLRKIPEDEKTAKMNR